MRAVQFTAAARADLIEAHDWYESASPGLGGRFVTCVDDVVRRIEANPNQFPVAHRTIRRAMLRTFPYALMFVLDQRGDGTALACFHASRDPRQWRDL